MYSKGLLWVVLGISFLAMGCQGPNPPGRIWVEEINHKEAVLQWKEPVPDSDAPIYYYEFQTKENKSWTWGEVGRSHSNITPIKDLNPNTAYDFRVRAIDLKERRSEWRKAPGNVLTSFLITRPSDMDLPSVDPRKEDFYFSEGPSTSKEVELGNRLPIILVHGMSSENRTATLNYWYWWLNDYFNDEKYAGLFKVYRYVYNSTAPILKNGEEFASFVNEYPELQGRRVIVIGHSMGGLVSRCAMNINPAFNDKVIQLITLGTPHLGSPGANPCWFYYCVDKTWLEWWSHFVFEIGFNSLSRGCFDLAWYNREDVPVNTYAYREEILGTFPCREEYLDNSMDNPFLGQEVMRCPETEKKILAFGGYLGNSFQTGMGDDPIYKDTPMRSELVPSGLSNHIALFIARNRMADIYDVNGVCFNESDGLVPISSSLYKTSSVIAVNITETLGEYLDHSSLLDNVTVMDFVMSYIWEIVDKN